MNETHLSKSHSLNSRGHQSAQKKTETVIIIPVQGSSMIYSASSIIPRIVDIISKIYLFCLMFESGNDCRCQDSRNMYENNDHYCPWVMWIKIPSKQATQQFSSSTVTLLHRQSFSLISQSTFYDQTQTMTVIIQL